MDEQQVNLDRFNLFFPEKRPFFLENAGLFTVGKPARSSCSSAGGSASARTARPMPILGGGRVSGKVGRSNVGLLDMQTDGTRPERAVQQQLRASSASPTNCRTARVGALFVDRSGTGDHAGADDDNRTYAVDGRWGIGRYTFIGGLRGEDRDARRRRAGDHA